MKKLIKNYFELSVKQSWLKTIDKELDKCNRIRRKLNRQTYVVNSLLERYKEIYGEDLKLTRKGEQQ